MRLAMAIGALALTGCMANAGMQASEQAEAAEDLAKALGDRQPGEPQDCVNASMVDGPQIIDRDTILYRESGRRIWRNELRSSCPALRPMTTIVVEIHGSRLCRNDRFRVLEPGASIPSAYCVLGQFTPYEKK